MAKQSVETIRKKTLRLDLMSLETGKSLTDDEIRKLAYDTPVLQLVPIIQNALDNKIDNNLAPKPRF